MGVSLLLIVNEKSKRVKELSRMNMADHREQRSTMKTDLRVKTHVVFAGVEPEVGQWWSRPP